MTLPRPLNLLIGLLVLTVATPAFAEQWDDHTHIAKLAFHNRDFDRAEAEFRQALELAQKLPQGNQKLEISLDNLARFYENRSRLDDAQPMFQLLLAAQEERLGTDHPALLDTIAAVARVSLSTGDVPTAQSNLKRYVALADASEDPDSEQLARILLLLARSALIMERVEEALPLQRRAVEVMTADDRLDDLEIAVAMDTLAKLEIAHGDPSRAEALVIGAAHRREAGGELGFLASSLTSAAGAAAAAHHPEIARQLVDRALADPDITTDLAIEVRLVLAEAAWLHFPLTSAELADLVGSVDPDPATAIAVSDLQSALAFLSQMPPDPRFDQVGQHLVSALVMTGDLDGAVAIQQQRCERAADHVAAQALVVELLLIAGDTAKAAVENQELIDLIEDRDGPASSQLITPLVRQYDLLKSLKQRKQAKVVKKRLRAIRRGLGG